MSEPMITEKTLIEKLKDVLTNHHAETGEVVTSFQSYWYRLPTGNNLHHMEIEKISINIQK